MRGRQFGKRTRSGVASPIRINFAVLGSIGCCLALAILTGPAVSLGRQALWQTVRACVVDFKLTGAAFPCLRVDLTGGEDQGYVLVRAPFGLSDTILAPTRKVVGVEDPWLQLPAAPNYFEAAWRTRAQFDGADGRPAQPDDFALAVNSALARSQDQLHIHLGCLVPATKQRLSRLAPQLPIGAWTRIGGLIDGAELWALRPGRADLTGVEPFRMSAKALAHQIRDRAQLTIFVTGVRALNNDELLVLASYTGVRGPQYQVETEDILDTTCLSPGNVHASN
jgi:CDP-diacylglycerol pyrophosphatase